MLRKAFILTRLVNLPMDPIVSYAAEEVPEGIVEAARNYERLLPDGETFSHYLQFDREYFYRLPACVIKHCTESEFPQIFSEVANSRDPTYAERRRYLSSLTAAYHRMADLVEIDERTVLVGPQREGALLVKQLGWDARANTTLYPHAKRIPYKGGIVVGVKGCECHSDVTNAVIIDGAIASAATLTAIMRMLGRRKISRFTIFSVHATEKGLSVLDRYASENGISLTIHVGYVSGILNEKFYAVYPEDPARLVVGDLGDTISVLFPEYSSIDSMPSPDA
jgi:hypothetical protein